MGWGGGRSWVSRMRTPAPPPRPAEDGLLRCKQLTVLLDWAEQFEAESRQSDEAVVKQIILVHKIPDRQCLGYHGKQRMRHQN